MAFAARQQLTEDRRLQAALSSSRTQQGYSTGVAQNLKEFTGTYEYKLPVGGGGLLGRLEYRHDWSDQPYFHKGNESMIDSPGHPNRRPDCFLRTQAIGLFRLRSSQFVDVMDTRDARTTEN